jgi:hypothetical protein
LVVDLPLSSFSFHPSNMIDATGPQIARIVAQTISSVLSILGSSALLWIARRNFHKVYNRQVSVLSIYDIIFSVHVLLQPWLSPSGVALKSSIGTTASCTGVALFAIHSYLAVAFSNCTLSLYFLLRVVYGWQDRTIVNRFELPAYALAMLGPLVISIPAFVTESLNPDQFLKMCFVDGFPAGCLDDGGDVCTRGSRITVWLSFAMGGIVVCASFVGFFGTYQVYNTVRKRLKSTANYSFQCAPTESMSLRLQEVSRQAVLYSLVYVNSFMWPTLYTIVALVSSADKEVVQWLEYICWTLAPLQGLLNFLVFCRPDLHRWRNLHPTGSILWAFRMVLLSDPPSHYRGRSSLGSRFAGSTEQMSTMGSPPKTTDTTNALPYRTDKDVETASKPKNEKAGLFRVSVQSEREPPVTNVSSSVEDSSP